MRTHIAIVRDHSVSMRGLAKAALDDYNSTLDSIRDTLASTDDAYISIIECGVGPTAKVNVLHTNLNARTIKRAENYVVSGPATPLLDSVGAAIGELEKNVNSWSHETDAFLVLVITDGEENRSKFWTKSSLTEKIRTLTNTDKWTFVFRGPKGSKQVFASLGVAEGNVMEWEQTTAGYAASTAATTQGIQTYMAARSRGVTSSTGFYANITASREEIAAVLPVSTDKFWTYHVNSWDDGVRIDEFVTKITGAYVPGRALYQLTKMERIVQDYKEIAIRDKFSREIYSGLSEVRAMLGLPKTGNVKLNPGNHANYDIFIQSTSLNRKLVGSTDLLYRR